MKKSREEVIEKGGTEDGAAETEAPTLIAAINAHCHCCLVLSTSTVRARHKISKRIRLDEFTFINYNRYY